MQILSSDQTQWGAGRFSPDALGRRRAALPAARLVSRR
jgi:hypothetical protein